MSTKYYISALFAITLICCNKKICKNSNSGKVKVSEETSVKHIEDKNNEFVLLSSHYEAHTAGIASGYNSLEYFFKILINTEEKINFDSAWIQQKSFVIFISKESTVVSSKAIPFHKGDSIILRVSDIQDYKNENKIANPPIQHSGEALIRYIINGNKKYFSIPEIGKRKTPNLPMK